jgi:uncharacterized protein (PEP-CTERM system associated)
MATAPSGASRWWATTDRGHACRNPILLLSLSFALPAMMSFPASAAKWEIVPTLTLSETYTDNISLTADAAKQDEWITQLVPGISVTATGPQLRLNASYSPQLTYYAQEQRGNEVFHRLNATANAELAEQLLFLDAGATVDQYNVSLQGPLTTSNVNTSGNRSTANTFFVSPFLLREFGSAVRAEARYTYSFWRSDAPASSLSNSEGNRINLRLASGSAYKLLTWELAYSKETIDYEDVLEPDTDTEVVTANARRLITPSVALLARAGYEDYHYRVVGPGAGGSAWGAGFEWAPTPRTALTTLAGERFYGNTYFLDFRHRTRLTAWSAGYSEDITSARSLFFLPATTSTSGYLNTLYSSRFPDPVAREKAVEEFIARAGLPQNLSDPTNFYTSELFLLKRWHASLGLLGVRNTLIANIFKDTREALPGNLALTSQGDFTVSDEIRQTGGSLAWNHRLSGRSALNVRGTYTRIEFPETGQIDKRAEGEVSLSRQLQPRLSGSLAYRRLDNDSNFAGSEYRENSVIASLQMRF